MGELGERKVQLELLDKIQDELVYALECLVYDYTGEAKSEVSELVENIGAMTTLDASYRASLVKTLDELLNELRNDNSSRPARNKLITLRRQVANTRLHLQGKEFKYNYADILTATNG